MQQEHIPVLLNEVIDGLSINPDGIYVDGTFGCGGHSSEILKHLSAKGQLIVVDKDPRAIAIASNLRAQDHRVSLFHESFRQIKHICSELNLLGKVDGVLLDLGVSSVQLDIAERGFSFAKDGPLDMRMDTSSGDTVADWLAVASAEDIIWVLREYGQERFAKRIASAIIDVRGQHRITTTKQLVDILDKAIPFKEKHKHYATRSFQAFRIFINQELHDLQQVLPGIMEVLAPGGRMAIISFHSLEDRMVKQFINKFSTKPEMPRKLPIRDINVVPDLIKIGKAIKASEQEVKDNSRARSAILRIAEKKIAKNDSINNLPNLRVV